MRDFFPSLSPIEKILSAYITWNRTFFGGTDRSWATPKTAHTQYKNFQMFAGSGSDTGSETGPSSNSSSDSGSLTRTNTKAASATGS